jgi:hypothetical protein
MSYHQSQVPRIETQRSTQVSDVSDQAGNADLLVNNLVYEQPKALSLAVNRTYKRQYFQRSQYAGSRSTTGICDWNTGTSYVNPANSYLTFTVTTTGGNANFGSGSAMNCISEIRIRSRSGTEMDRLEQANLWSKYDSLYAKNDAHLTTLGSVQGFGATRDGATDAANMTAGTATKFNLPLSVLTPFFRPLKKQLIPPQLASGLHIEIVFEDFRTALFQKTATVTAYTIDSIEFNLDCVELTDDTQRTINMESANDGLEYCYERIYTATSQQPTGQTSLSQQVRKAVSQACLATTIAMSQADKIDVTKESLNSVTFNYNNYWYRLGSLYFPSSKIESASDGVEAYTIAQQVYDKYKNPWKEGSMTLANFTAKHGILSASFEKDTNLNMSGLPVNNSRVLELNCEFAAVAENLDVVTFLQYCSVARCFIDNTAVAL